MPALKVTFIIIISVTVCLYCKAVQLLCVILAGETGIGKSTLMDTLFNNNFDSTPSTHDLPDVKLKSRTYGMSHLLYTMSKN